MHRRRSVRFTSCSPAREPDFSQFIHFVTDDQFTHVSIGLDSPEGPFYSFGRKNPNLLFPAGLVEESVGQGFYSQYPGTPCCLYTLNVSPRIYRRLRRQVGEMYRQRDLYHYNLLGALSCFFHLPLNRQWHYFCSQFVACILEESGALAFSKPSALVRPVDFCRLDQLQPIHQGEVGALP